MTAGEPQAPPPYPPPAFGPAAHPVPRRPYPLFGVPGPDAGPIPRTYRGWAVVTLLVCLPAGIVALVLGARIPGYWAVGDVAGARRTSRTTLAWILAGLGLTLALLAVSGVVTALAVAHSSSGS